MPGWQQAGALSRTQEAAEPAPPPSVAAGSSAQEAPRVNGRQERRVRQGWQPYQPPTAAEAAAPRFVSAADDGSIHVVRVHVSGGQGQGNGLPKYGKLQEYGNIVWKYQDNT